MDYKEFRLIGSIVKHMNNYAAIKYLLNYGYTYNKRKKRSKDILIKYNYLCLLSPCKKYRIEFNLTDYEYSKIYFLI